MIRTAMLADIYHEGPNEHEPTARFDTETPILEGSEAAVGWSHNEIATRSCSRRRRRFGGIGVCVRLSI